MSCAFAVSARETAVSDPQHARKLACASYVVSSVGIVVSIVVLAVVLGVGGLCLTGHKHDGVCYRYKSSLYSSSECTSWTVNGVYDDGYCYYD